MQVQAAPASFRAWKPQIGGVREVFHASWDHAYPAHTHDTWTLFVVDDGAVRYDLDRHHRGATSGMVSILPPHVVHDGVPATNRGYRKRVLYMETSVLGEALIGPAVDRPAIAVPGIRRHVSALHDALACVDDLIEAETRFAFVVERIRAALGSPAPERPAAPAAELAERLRAYLDARVCQPVTLASASADIGAGSTQLARAFATAFGIPPHAYVLGRRVEAARDRILAGQPLADVAAEVGFCDQAHLTRRFQRFLGMTPGRFALGAPIRPGRR